MHQVFNEMGPVRGRGPTRAIFAARSHCWPVAEEFIESEWADFEKRTTRVNARVALACSP